MPSCNAPSEKISRLVDYLQSLPSYLKGTTDFLLRLDTLGTLLPEAILVTPNVLSLYIPSSHKKRGFRHCRGAQHQTDTGAPSRRLVTKTISVFLAPSYANILMVRLENHILTGRNLRLIVSWRFIDNNFFCDMDPWRSPL